MGRGGMRPARASGPGPPVAGPGRASHVLGTPDLARRTARPPRRLSIQEEQGAPGTAGRTTTPNRLCEEKGAHHWPMREKGRARAQGRQPEVEATLSEPMGGDEGGALEGALEYDRLEVCRWGKSGARLELIGWEREGGAPRSARGGGGHGGKQRLLPEGERRGWGRGVGVRRHALRAGASPESSRDPSLCAPRCSPPGVWGEAQRPRAPPPQSKTRNRGSREEPGLRPCPP